MHNPATEQDACDSRLARVLCCGRVLCSQVLGYALEAVGTPERAHRAVFLAFVDVREAVGMHGGVLGSAEPSICSRPEAAAVRLLHRAIIRQRRGCHSQTTSFGVDAEEKCSFCRDNRPPLVVELDLVKSPASSALG